MNNATVIKEMFDSKTDVTSALRERESTLLEIIDALQNVGGSSYWKILSKEVFDVELAKSKRRLEIESDTTEMFRLQGEARLGRRYHLDKLITKYRNELQAIKQKIK